VSKDPALPEGVFAKGASYYKVVADGKRRIWNRLSKIRDGLPAMYAALAKFLADQTLQGKMPSMIAEWEAELLPRYSPKWQGELRKRNLEIAEAFAEFYAKQVTTPDCVEFLKHYRTGRHKSRAGKPTPRTFNLYRSQLSELFRFSEEKGYRDPGSNPVTPIRTMTEKARTRCPTTSELRRVKVGCLYGDDGRRTRSGLTMCCLIELAYLSGQDVSVMIRLRDQRDTQDPDEPHVIPEGIFFQRDKTGKAVIIEWTPRLRAVVSALRRLKAERLLKKRAAQRVDTPFLFTKQDGTPLTYEAVSNAWQRGLKRSKVLPFMFRDIRAAALTDKEEREGMRAANTMGTHSTETQTADYVRRRRARKTKATA
jgi:site-specific recombinase XerD